MVSKGIMSEKYNLVDFSAIAVCIISCLVYFVPSDLYMRVLGENLYTRSSGSSAYFIILGTIGFLFGSYLASKIKISYSERLNNKWMSMKIGTGYIALFFAALLSIIYIYVVSKSFSLSVLIGGSNESRYSLWVFLSDNKLGFLIPVAVSLTCFGMYTTIIYNYKNPHAYFPLLVTSGLLILIAQVLGIKAVIFNIVVAFVASIYLLYLKRNISKRFMLYAFSIGLIALASFFLYSVSQRITNINGVNSVKTTDIYMFSIFGYFFSGINKFAYIYSGGVLFTDLSFWNFLAPITNTPLLGGVYTKSLSDLGISVSSVNPDAWQSSFDNVSLSGFNSGFNVLSIYGNLFGNFNWLGIVAMFFYGIIARIMWRYYTNGVLLGVLLFPYILFSTIQWLVYDPFFSREFMINVLVAGVLFLIQEVFIKRIKI